MIYSPSRAEDNEWRLKVLDEMLDALKNNLPVTAKCLGQLSAYLYQKMQTYDYTRDDLFHYKLEDVRHGITLKK